MAQNTPRGTPARVLILFALLTGAVVVAAFRDFLTPDADRITWPTAVGDTVYHKPGTEPPPMAAGGSLFTLREDPADRLQRRDDRMWRVPLPLPQPRLYSPVNSFPADQVPPLYLKTGPGEYLRVELEKAETPE